MADTYTLFFDGACAPRNPGGTAAYGWLLYKGGELLETGHAVLGTGMDFTNNVAEYAGLYEGLAAFAEHHRDGYATLTVRGDSNMVIQQMSGAWRAKAGLYMPNFKMAQGLAASLRKRGVRITWEWVPRENNAEADKLSKAHLRAVQ